MIKYGAIMHKLIRVFLAMALVASWGCADKVRTRLNTPKRDEWLITGRVSSALYGSGRVIALNMDGTRYITNIKEDRSFGIDLPGSSTYVLYFLSGDKNARSKEIDTDIFPPTPGLSANISPSFDRPNFAVLSFEDGPDVGESETLRLPEPLINAFIDLGLVDIKGKNAYPAHNPSLVLDYDYDGIPDIADLDDQNDNLPDAIQKKKLEEIIICKARRGQKSEELKVPFANLLLHLDNGAALGSCPKK